MALLSVHNQTTCWVLLRPGQKALFSPFQPLDPFLLDPHNKIIYIFLNLLSCYKWRFFSPFFKMFGNVLRNQYVAIVENLKYIIECREKSSLPGFCFEIHGSPSQRRLLSPVLECSFKFFALINVYKCIFFDSIRKASYFSHIVLYLMFVA